MIKYEKYSQNELSFLKGFFIDNELETDEYREAQPVKGLMQVSAAPNVVSLNISNMIDAWIEDLIYSESLDEKVSSNLQDRYSSQTMGIVTLKTLIDNLQKYDDEKNIDLLIVWLKSYTGRYTGVSNLKPLLEEVWKSHFNDGTHPYGYSEKELDEWIKECYEGE